MHMNKESALYDPCVDMYTSNGRISIYRNKKICTLIICVAIYFHLIGLT